MKRRLIHKRTIYYLPRGQGGDIVLPLCQKAAIGWSDFVGRVFLLADIGISCPSCMGLMKDGLRPNAPSKRAALQRSAASRVARLSVPRVSTRPGMAS